MKTTPFGTPFHYWSGSSAIVAATILIGAAIAFPCRAQNSYIQHNLVSDISGLADHTDPQLVNPWGIASTDTSPFWVSDNGTGVSTLYNSSGTKLGLVVTIPPPATPTGVVFNSTTAFNGDRFIFATEGGTIDGWRGALGTSAETLAISSGISVFKGIAIATQATGTYIYAADFLQGNIAVFPGTAGMPSLPGNFTDPNLPSGYAPFNIQTININNTNSLLVTYAVQDASKHDEVDGAGFGIVDRFDLNGNFVQRLISNGALSALNAPWGMTIAPADFGLFSGDLLVGNFGDGRINAFDPLTGTFLGTLLDNTSGNPIEIPGLWGLRVGNGGNGGDVNSVYFAAGIPGPDAIEDHGLFGSLTVPDSGATFTMMAFALAAIACCARLLQTGKAS